MIENIERREDGVGTAIKRSLEEDSPVGVFYIAFHVTRSHEIVFTQNLSLRGLAAFLRELAGNYEKAADENNGEMPPDRIMQ